ncbi:MAG: pilus assembly protein [Deltaproteobacteria bacterium]|nr:pilus assembly protein [Deltaproteobacteria bacterium]
MGGNQSIRGVVYVEFLIVIIPLLILMFSLVQMSLFLSAGILTQLAANKAARSAMVILSDDHPDATYDEKALNQVGTGANGIEAYRNIPKKSRYHAIRLAARAPLIPVSPTLESATSESIEGALRNVGIFETGADLANMGWTWFFTGLGFVNGKDEYVATINPGDDVRVQVVFLYPCFIPIGRSLTCHSWGDLPKEDMDLIKLYGNQTAIAIFGMAGLRYVTLRAEAPIPRWDR